MFQLESGRKVFFHTVLFVVIYVFLFYCLQFFLARFGMAAHYPTGENITSWDAGWYRAIAERGYIHDDQGQSNTGFYFLFPFLWKILHLNAWGISAFNALCFATGLGVIASLYKLSVAERLLLLTMPQVIIAFVPYSEALFFLLSALSFLGVHQQNRGLTWISLFLLSLTRATTITLIPAFLAMELLTNDRNLWGKSLVRYLVNYFLPLITGLAVFVLIQYAQTGVWFAYFKAQSTFWMRIYSPPIFPLKGSDYSTFWLNAMAVFVCFIAALYLITFSVRWLIRNVRYEKELVLSISYLAITLYLTLFYSAKWEADKTDVIGTFRYALLNPFFFRFLIYLTKECQYKWQHYVLAIILASGTWMAFGAYIHIQYFLFFTGNTVIIVLYMLNSNKKLEWPAFMVIALNFFFQVFYFQKFISQFSIVD
jgi:hypothetical protein